MLVGNTTGLGQVGQPDTAPTPTLIDTAPAPGTGPTQTARPAGPSQTREDRGSWPNPQGSAVPDTSQGPDMHQLTRASPSQGIPDVEMGAWATPTLLLVPQPCKCIDRCWIPCKGQTHVN